MDEFKIRLPVVLNGSYSLLFTFFHVSLQTKKVLDSSSNLESKFGYSVCAVKFTCNVKFLCNVEKNKNAYEYNTSQYCTRTLCTSLHYITY